MNTSTLLKNETFVVGMRGDMNITAASTMSTVDREGYLSTLNATTHAGLGYLNHTEGAPSSSSINDTMEWTTATAAPQNNTTTTWDWSTGRTNGSTLLDLIMGSTTTNPSNLSTIERTWTHNESIVSDTGGNHTSDYYYYAQAFHQILPPVILFLGTLSNIACVVVFQRKELKKVVTTLYYRTLVIGDLVILYVLLVPIILQAYWDINISSVPGLCRFIFYMLHTAVDFSVIALIVLNIERLLSVLQPVKQPAYWTFRRGLKSLVAMVTLAFIINIPAAVTPNFCTPDPTSNLSCKTSHDIFEFCCINLWCSPSSNAKMWLSFELIIYLIIPAIVMVICNTGINWTLCLSEMRKEGSRCVQLSSMAKILLSLCIVHLILTTPVALTGILCQMNDFLITDSKKLFINVAYLLMAINCCVKFVIFRSICPRFTQQCMNLCCPCVHYAPPKPQGRKSSTVIQMDKAFAPRPKRKVRSHKIVRVFSHFRSTMKIRRHNTATF